MPSELRVVHHRAHTSADMNAGYFTYYRYISVSVQLFPLGYQIYADDEGYLNSNIPE